MYRLKPGVKQDPARRWSLPDRVFFAHGACHILAGVYLSDPPRTGFRAERIVPARPFSGNHVYVTDGTFCFDYRGYVPRDRLLSWYAAQMTRATPGWRGVIEAVRFDLLDAAALNARKMRGPDQYLHDPIPRARVFLESKWHDPRMSDRRGSDPKRRVAMDPASA